MSGVNYFHSHCRSKLAVELQMDLFALRSFVPLIEKKMQIFMRQLRIIISIRAKITL